MVPYELLFYIKSETKKGIALPAIVATLEKSGGWTKADIDEACAMIPELAMQLPKKSKIIPDIVVAPTLAEKSPEAFGTVATPVAPPAFKPLIDMRGVPAGERFKGMPGFEDRLKEMHHRSRRRLSRMLILFVIIAGLLAGAFFFRGQLLALFPSIVSKILPAPTVRDFALAATVPVNQEALPLLIDRSSLAIPLTHVPPVAHGVTTITLSANGTFDRETGSLFGTMKIASDIPIHALTIGFTKQGGAWYVTNPTTEPADPFFANSFLPILVAGTWYRLDDLGDSGYPYEQSIRNIRSVALFIDRVASLSPKTIFTPTVALPNTSGVLGAKTTQALVVPEYLRASGVGFETNDAIVTYDTNGLLRDLAATIRRTDPSAGFLADAFHIDFHKTPTQSEMLLLPNIANAESLSTVLKAHADAVRDEELLRIFGAVKGYGASFYTAHAKSYLGACTAIDGFLPFATHITSLSREPLCADSKGAYRFSIQNGSGSFLCTDSTGAFGTALALSDDLACGTVAPLVGSPLTDRDTDQYLETLFDLVGSVNSAYKQTHGSFAGVCLATRLGPLMAFFAGGCNDSVSAFALTAPLHSVSGWRLCADSAGSVALTSATLSGTVCR